jgi:hypothetical protein
MDNYGVTHTREFYQHIQIWTIRILPGGLVYKRAVNYDSINLAFWILIKSTDPNVANARPNHGIS